ncbi:hypothetical protein [Candidatus Arsenophonus triatominarum]|uniref:hypothetical protein n=1 Tax=Candidatus Arsenophonus triatominarum TaxID=57911 RepID=UPI0007C53395|nr:hypothetical protein [Candidatus Arsenophonus triatominarum]
MKNKNVRRFTLSLSETDQSEAWLIKHLNKSDKINKECKRALLAGFALDKASPRLVDILSRLLGDDIESQQIKELVYFLANQANLPNNNKTNDYSTTSTNNYDIALKKSKSFMAD